MPFLLTAVAFTRMTGAFRWLRDRYLIITAVSGVVLIAMGVLLFTGELQQLNIKAQEGLERPRPELLQRRLDTRTVWLIVVGWIRQVSLYVPGDGRRERSTTRSRCRGSSRRTRAARW